jgi:hypothetical protein
MNKQPPNAARKAAAAELAQLAPLRELAAELDDYPVRLLAQLCELAETRQGPVPDHAITLLPYLGETALRALVEGGYAERVDDVSYAINAYLPTAKGKALAASLTAPDKKR